MRLLFLEFEALDQPGRLGAGMVARGARCDVVRTHRGDALPALDQYEAVIALGGSMNAEDDSHHPYLAEVVRLLRDAHARELPTLGVCLGGQLLARALGARIWRKPRTEIGYFPIQPTQAGRDDRLFRDLGEEILTFQWHEDAFDLPAGATLLADSRRDTYQAFRHGKSYGIQFHPEIDPSVIESWASTDQSQLPTAAQPITFDALMRTAQEVDVRFAAQTECLCHNWMTLIEDAASSKPR